MNWTIRTLLFLAALPFPVAASEGGAHGDTFMDLFLMGGAVSWLLLAASILIMAYAIEAVIKIRVGRLAPPAVYAQLKDAFVSGNYPQAVQICAANPCYLARIVQAGVERLGRGRDAAEKAMGEVTAKEINDLKSNINYLSVIGVVSPMVGLTGTVIGMMKAFKTLGSSGAADPSKLSANISEVLFATAFGLFVAIPGFVLYYVFRNRVQTVTVAVEQQIGHLFEEVPFEQLTGYRVQDYLGEGAAAGTPAPAVA